MKKLLTATALAAMVATTAQAKEVHLDCSYATTEGRSEVTKIMLDTEKNMGSTYERLFTKVKEKSWMSEGGTFVYPVGSGTGKLYSDGTHYWFSVPKSSGYDKFQIDRNDLTIVMDGMSPSPTGTCKVIEAPRTKI